MVRVLAPGSFDPVTLGHVDVFERASRLFDVVVCVAHNSGKAPLFDVTTRVRLVQEATAHIPNLQVISASALSVDVAIENGCSAILKGVRGVLDLEWEQTQAWLNADLAGVETVWLPASRDFLPVSSSIVKQLAAADGDLTAFVPDGVACALRAERKDS
ncbi:MAG: pantetheine-phosphate adenylyltransferase [Varibaculum sp.]|nr:pantetheine-phosphate adenylyltransferase [Varibaculum sp.]